jgi:hypothetical protein
MYERTYDVCNRSAYIRLHECGEGGGREKRLTVNLWVKNADV